MFFFHIIIALRVVIVAATQTLPDGRPPIEDRTFRSTAIDKLIDTLVPLMKNPDLGVLLSNCLPNTLDTTVSYYTSVNASLDGANLDSFIITGDINALWLRDSGNQVIPYLPYGPSDESLQYLFEGLIARHASSIVLDPFANSFNFNSSKREGHQDDSVKPPMTYAVFESKYEIDSLCAFLKLSYWHYRYSGVAALLRFATDSWFAAVQKLLDTGGVCCM
jgi:meiotically up-regulated gene 157 (Mug157) protein